MTRNLTQCRAERDDGEQCEQMVRAESSLNAYCGPRGTKTQSPGHHGWSMNESYTAFVLQMCGFVLARDTRDERRGRLQRSYQPE